MIDSVHLLKTNFQQLNTEQQNEKIKLLKTEILKRIFQITQENKYNPNCIDGRDNNASRPSIPGGKFGALGVVLASLDSLTDGKYDKQGIVNIVKDYFKGSFGGHTDTHADYHGHGCECNGCGHVYRLLNEGKQRYHLSQESIDKMKQSIGDEDAKNISILPGEHKERNVLVMGVEGYGIQSNYNDVQDFVYNAAYAENMYSELAEKISTKTSLNIDVLTQQFIEINNIHVNETAGDLAQLKDMFNISNIEFDTNNTPIDCDIDYLQTIPKK